MTGSPMPTAKGATEVEDSELEEPADLQRAFAAAPQAHALFKGLTRIARRDFIRWITSAKQPETRARRIASACDMICKGKRRVCCFDTSPWKTKDGKSKYRRSASK
jgi:uncharacterized protein YdeI (YjbR/CyaY-like superfamily)